MLQDYPEPTDQELKDRQYQKAQKLCQIFDLLEKILPWKKAAIRKWRHAKITDPVTEEADQVGIHKNLASLPEEIQLPIDTYLEDLQYWNRRQDRNGKIASRRAAISECLRDFGWIFFQIPNKYRSRKGLYTGFNAGEPQEAGNAQYFPGIRKPSRWNPKYLHRRRRMLREEPLRCLLFRTPDLTPTEIRWASHLIVKKGNPNHIPIQVYHLLQDEDYKYLVEDLGLLAAFLPPAGNREATRDNTGIRYSHDLRKNIPVPYKTSDSQGLPHPAIHRLLEFNRAWINHIFEIHVHYTTWIFEPILSDEELVEHTLKSSENFLKRLQGDAGIEAIQRQPVLAQRLLGLSQENPELREAGITPRILEILAQGL
jgi:hypothetical protein